MRVRFAAVLTTAFYPPKAHGHFVRACAKGIEFYEFGAIYYFERAACGIYAVEKILSREMKECNKITHFSITMDFLRVCWEFR